MMVKTPRVALYARVSTKDKGQDTENQLRQLRQFAGTQGWVISQEYVDRTTGKRGDRERFQKMFLDASRREFDVLLFWSGRSHSGSAPTEVLNEKDDPKVALKKSELYSSLWSSCDALRGGMDAS